MTGPEWTYSPLTHPGALCHSKSLHKKRERKKKKQARKIEKAKVDEQRNTTEIEIHLLEYDLHAEV